MNSPTKLALALFVLCTACAETGDDDDNYVNPGLTGTPDSGLPIVADSGVMADATPSGPVGPAPEASVSNPTPGNDTGVSTLVDAGRADTGVVAPVDAGKDSGPTTTPTTTCSKPGTGMPGSTSNLTLNGRNYTLHIGRSVDPSKPAPLIFSLHGLTMTPASMELMARWDPVADSEGLIIARPAGVGASNGWDLTGTKDFDLMKAIIEDVDAKSCVDRKRIYATGFSHGGFMSFAIACKLGDIFAAVAPNAGSGSAARGCGARPVPVYAFHGDADGVVSYSSGQTAVNSWVSHNKCTGTPESFMVMNAQCKDWNMCDAGGQVKFCTIPGLGHTYFRGATAAIWEFFKAHPLP